MVRKEKKIFCNRLFLACHSISFFFFFSTAFLIIRSTRSTARHQWLWMKNGHYTMTHSCFALMIRNIRKHSNTCQNMSRLWYAKRFLAPWINGLFWLFVFFADYYIIFMCQLLLKWARSNFIQHIKNICFVFKEQTSLKIADIHTQKMILAI